jgi:F-type H+-transporting ATPase subunit b
MMALDAEFFVALGFVLFVALVAYLGVHSKIGATLDARAERIKAQLAEAERFRQEAAAVLASFERRKAEAQAEAEAIVAQARAEAELIAKEAHERIAEFIVRRTKQAEEKIATAEAQAAAEVRSVAADAATAAAATVLKAEVKGPFGERLLSKSITDLKMLVN